MKKKVLIISLVVFIVLAMSCLRSYITVIYEKNHETKEVKKEDDEDIKETKHYENSESIKETINSKEHTISIKTTADKQKEDAYKIDVVLSLDSKKVYTHTIDYDTYRTENDILDIVNTKPTIKKLKGDDKKDYFVYLFNYSNVESIEEYIIFNDEGTLILSGQVDNSSKIKTLKGDNSKKYYNSEEKSYHYISFNYNSFSFLEAKDLKICEKDDEINEIEFIEKNISINDSKVLIVNTTSTYKGSELEGKCYTTFEITKKIELEENNNVDKNVTLDFKEFCIKPEYKVNTDGNSKVTINNIKLNNKNNTLVYIRDKDNNKEIYTLNDKEIYNEKLTELKFSNICVYDNYLLLSESWEKYPYIYIYDKDGNEKALFSGEYKYENNLLNIKEFKMEENDEEHYTINSYTYDLKNNSFEKENVKTEKFDCIDENEHNWC